MTVILIFSSETKHVTTFPFCCKEIKCGKVVKITTPFTKHSQDVNTIILKLDTNHCRFDWLVWSIANSCRTDTCKQLCQDGKKMFLASCSLCRPAHENLQYLSCKSVVLWREGKVLMWYLRSCTNIQCGNKQKNQICIFISVLDLFSSHTVKF